MHRVIPNNYGEKSGGHFSFRPLCIYTVLLIILFQNTSLTWHTFYPEFTSCFKNTVLLWIPCLFLWIFAGIEVYFLTNSQKRNVPSNWINISKLLINGCLILLVVIEMIPFSSTSTTVHDVDIYSPIIKIVTLVSKTLTNSF